MDKSDQQDIKPLSIIKQDVMLSGTTTASHHPMQTILSIPAHHNINNNNNNSGNNNNSIMNNEIKTNMDAMSTNINNGLSNQNNITFAENILSTLQQHQLQQLQQQQQQQQQQQLTAATDATQKGVAINHADLLNSLQTLKGQPTQQFLLNNSLQLPTSNTNLPTSNPIQHLLIPISLPTNQLNLMNGQLYTPQQLAFTLPNNNNNPASQTLQPVLMVGPQLSVIMGQVGQTNQGIQNIALRQLMQQQQQQQNQQQLTINSNNSIPASSMVENNTSLNTVVSTTTTIPTLFNNNNNNNNNNATMVTTPTSLFQPTPQAPLFAIANPQLLQQTLAAMMSKNLQHKIILSPNNNISNNNNNISNNNNITICANTDNNTYSTIDNIATTTAVSTAVAVNNNNNLLTTITLATTKSSVINTMTTTTPTFTLPSSLKIITTTNNNTNSTTNNINNNPSSKVLSQVTQVLINNNTQTQQQQQPAPLLLDQSSVLTSSINQLLPNTISSSRDGTVIDGVNLDEMREFAKQFKLRRLSLGLTQTQVGQALSITEGPSYSQSAICRFEKLDITPKSAQKIKPVLERWMNMAEERLKMGGQALTDYGGLENSKKRKRRTSFTPSAIEALNEHFELNSHPTGTEMTTLADQLNFDREVIRVWFCNKRQTLKNTIKKFKTPNSPLS